MNETKPGEDHEDPQPQGPMGENSLAASVVVRGFEVQLRGERRILGRTPSSI